MKIEKKNSMVFLVGISFLVSLLMGCGLKYNLKEPSPSTVNYPNSGVPTTTMTIVDKREGENLHFTTGKIGPGGSVVDISKILTFQNIDDPIAFFSTQLEKELNQRGLPVKCIVGRTGDSSLSLEVNRYQIVNYRATGFSPWEACHVFDGIVVLDGKREGIKAYFYNGKTPVWSMDEIQEPCFNIPSSILIKDVASKINRAVFKLQASDAKVNQLAAEIDTEMTTKPEIGPIWKVLELGYTNNPNAMMPLKKFSLEGDELFKSCAISAIGILGAEGQFEFLKQRYNDTFYNEKYMAVKAIGDIGSQEAISFIRNITDQDIYNDEGGLKTCVDLYAK
jgi:hypothetical protein